jgi:hypothetical protein
MGCWNLGIGNAQHDCALLRASRLSTAARCRRTPKDELTMVIVISRPAALANWGAASGRPEVWAIWVGGREERDRPQRRRAAIFRTVH